jgi:hypothetical protein
MGHTLRGVYIRRNRERKKTQNMKVFDVATVKGPI